MRRNAFSLPELLVALGLSALVLSILAALVIWGMRVYTAQTVENTRFQLGCLVINRLRTDLRASSARAVSIWSEGGRAVVTIQRLKDLTSSGQQVWEDSLVVYTFAEGRVTRGLHRPAPSTSRPRRLAADQLRAISASSSVSMMDQVTSFKPRLQGRTFTVDLVTEYPVPHRAEPGRQQFQTSLSLRDNP